MSLQDLAAIALLSSSHDIAAFFSNLSQLARIVDYTQLRSLAKSSLQSLVIGDRYRVAIDVMRLMSDLLEEEEIDELWMKAADAGRGEAVFALVSEKDDVNYAPTVNYLVKKGNFPLFCTLVGYLSGREQISLPDVVAHIRYLPLPYAEVIVTHWERDLELARERGSLSRERTELTASLLQWWRRERKIEPWIPLLQRVSPIIPSSLGEQIYEFFPPQDPRFALLIESGWLSSSRADR